MHREINAGVCTLPAVVASISSDTCQVGLGTQQVLAYELYLDICLKKYYITTI